MIRLEIKGSVGVGKTTLISHLSYCLRKAGYEVSVEGLDPGELESLPPYFQLGQRVILSEVDTSPELRVRRSFWPYVLVIFCCFALFSALVLPLELAIKILTAVVVSMLVTTVISAVRK